MKRLILTCLCTFAATGAAYAQPAEFSPPVDGMPQVAETPPQAEPKPQPAMQARNDFNVTFSDAEESVSAALVEKGLGQKISALISNRRNNAIFSYSKPTTIEVHGLRVDKNGSHWNASLLFVADGEVVMAIPASGRYEEIVEIPVLKREIHTGELISDSDVEIKDFPVSQTRADTVNDLAALIGKTPVRTISPLRPIRDHEIGSPAIVKKNSVVQMHFNSPGMEITTTGQALGDGAKGDVIDVRNMASKKVVRGTVESTENVTIVAPNQETSQLTGAEHAQPY